MSHMLVDILFLPSSLHLLFLLLWLLGPIEKEFAHNDEHGETEQKIETKSAPEVGVAFAGKRAGSQGAAGIGHERALDYCYATKDREE